MLHRLCEPPSIPLSFSLATILPRRSTYRFRFVRMGRSPSRLVLNVYSQDYRGYLIPFATLAFVPQRQLRPSVPLSPTAFLPISTHFTAPLEVPHTPISLKPGSLERSFPVEPEDFTSYLPGRLRTL